MLNFAEQTGSGAVMIVWSFLSADDLPTVYIPCRTNPHTFTLLQPHPHNNCHFILLAVNYVSGLVCVCLCVCEGG
jgi:hypothetical protein